MLLQISEEERVLLARLVSRVLREKRDEISVTQTAGVMDIVMARKKLLTELFERLESGSMRAQAGRDDSDL
jgi:hypothetical protein